MVTALADVCRTGWDTDLRRGTGIQLRLGDRGPSRGRWFVAERLTGQQLARASEGHGPVASRSVSIGADTMTTGSSTSHSALTPNRTAGAGRGRRAGPDEPEPRFPVVAGDGPGHRGAPTIGDPRSVRLRHEVVDRQCEPVIVARLSSRAGRWIRPPDPKPRTRRNQVGAGRGTCSRASRGIRPRLREQAQVVEGDAGGCEGGVLGHVVGRGHFDDVHRHEVDSA